MVPGPVDPAVIEPSAVYGICGKTAMAGNVERCALIYTPSPTLV
jgi:hypothetical protein